MHPMVLPMGYRMVSSMLSDCVPRHAPHRNSCAVGYAVRTTAHVASRGRSTTMAHTMAYLMVHPIVHPMEYAKCAGFPWGAPWFPFGWPVGPSVGYCMEQPVEEPMRRCRSWGIPGHNRWYALLVCELEHGVPYGIHHGDPRGFHDMPHEGTIAP